MKVRSTMGDASKSVCVTIRLRGTKTTATVWGKRSALFRDPVYGIEIKNSDWRLALSSIRVKTRASKAISEEVSVSYIENERPKNVSCVVVIPTGSGGVSSSAVRLEVDSR